MNIHLYQLLYGAYQASKVMFPCLSCIIIDSSIDLINLPSLWLLSIIIYPHGTIIQILFIIYAYLILFLRCIKDTWSQIWIYLWYFFILTWDISPVRIQPLNLPVVFPWQALPYGDPSETTTAPRHHCDDALVRAHGAVTQAVPRRMWGFPKKVIGITPNHPFINL
jgi:hypothetical protein